jgi:hypothetical protein
MVAGSQVTEASPDSCSPATVSPYQVVKESLSDKYGAVTECKLLHYSSTLFPVFAVRMC